MPQPRQNKRPAGFTLVEIMIVVLIIGILLAIAVPNFVAARESSRARACVASLSQINSAKAQCAMDNRLSDVPAVSFSIDGTTATTPGSVYQLTRGATNPSGYLRGRPVCPSGGNYVLGAVSATPSCSVSTNPSASADYQPGGRWFHGY